MSAGARGTVAESRLELRMVDAKPLYQEGEAIAEANRCLYCHDAPCVEACPTGIDIPGFIRKIATDNVRGSAITILEENIMGGACARVCPTEILCEQACVRTAQEGKPVNIGALQRYATDWLFEREIQPFKRMVPSGKRVAVVGGGPAGLACAHRLAMLGHEAIVFEARSKGGGLNEYGVAAYKVAHDFAQREVAFILSLGGIDLRCGKALGRDVTLAQLRRDYDAVFLGTGLAGVNALKLEGESLKGVEDAVAYIERLRQADDKSTLPIGRRVVVIGGGNTAIDIAVQAKRLGAEDVTIVYRRGPENMGATRHEQEFAQTNGVRIKHLARPAGLIGENGALKAVEFERTGAEAGRFTLEADMLFKAIGQVFVAAPYGGDTKELLQLKYGRIAVNGERATSLPKVWAGGDCIEGPDLTVSAVEDGKIAARAIDRVLKQG